MYLHSEFTCTFVSMNVPVDIRKLSLDEIIGWFTAQGLPGFRAKQIYQWLWQKNANDFEEMTNLSKALREQLSQSFFIAKSGIDTVQYSSDGTIKTRIKLHDDHRVESVLIPVPREKRFTACISSQVGCSLTCSFCATGKMDRARNLDAGEIVDQFRIVNNQSLERFDHALTNVVYMGMGEPLLNYKEVLKSVDLLTNPNALGISQRRITVSTAGIGKMIKKLADDEVKFNLALSLHAADDAKRDKIMPINEQNNLEVLMEALNYFSQRCKGKITYEYIAFHEFNDSEQDADNLAKLCRRFPVKVNIIEYNPIEGFDMIKSGKDRLSKFADRLSQKRVQVTIRRSRGKDIDAACGQLANKN